MTDAPTGGKGGMSGTGASGGTGATGGTNGGTGATGGGGTSATGGTSGTDTGGGGGMPPEPECETNADCEAVDPDLYPVQPTVCVEATPGDPLTAACVPLKSAECPVLLPSVDEEQWLENLRGDDPIILGAFAPYGDTLVSNYTRAYDLAVTEFTRTEVGLPGPGGSRRPVVFVVCDHEGDQTLLETAADHLVGELKVPGLIPALFSDDLRIAFSHIGGAAAGVFFMSPLETDSSLANLDDQDLAWHLLPGGEYVALPYTPLLTRTIDYLHNETMIPMADPIKVALVTASDQRFLSDLSGKLRQDIMWNGVSFNQNLTDGNAINLTVPSHNEDPNAPLTTEIQAILDFAPHIIIGATDVELYTRIIPTVETNWAAEAPSGQPPPFYLVSPYNYGTGSFMTTCMTSFPAARTRIAGVNWASVTAEYADILTTYEIAWDSEFPEVQGRRGFENFYDAAYDLMYAVAANGSRLSRFDGFDLVDGMDRLQSGPAFAVGTMEMADALAVLAQAGRTITLNGTMGAPNFDTTGARSDPGSVWCINPGPTEVVDVLRYDSMSGDLVGTFPCIPNF
jgi:hypothetical protein